MNWSEEFHRGEPDEKAVRKMLKTLVEILAEEINAFAELYPHDVRPLQSLNGRVVKESQ